jgi:dTDP-4-dehydrorhamnose reductase
VAEAEQERDRCFQENALGPEHLARSCSRHGVKLVTFSSDLVFGKTSKGPFSEMDIPAPANVYGESKARAEEVVLNLLPSALVVRTSAFFGPWDEHNFVYHIMNQGYKGLETQLADDQRVSPTYVPDLVNATLDLLIDGAQGIWHLANKGSVSWLEFGQMVYRQAELDSGLLQPIATDQLALLAPRPANSTLISLKGDLMPTLESSLHQCVRELVELFPTKEAAIHL